MKKALHYATKQFRSVDGGIQKNNLQQSFMSVRVSYKCLSSTTRLPIVQLMEWAITLVALRVMSMALQSSLKISRISKIEESKMWARTECRTWLSNPGVHLGKEKV